MMYRVFFIFLLIVSCQNPDMNKPLSSLSLPDSVWSNKTGFDELREKITMEYRGIEKLDPLVMTSYVVTYISFKEDIDNFDTADYWQLPCETIAKGSGDCEDKAILFVWSYYQLTGDKNRFNIVKSICGEDFHISVLDKVTGTEYLMNENEGRRIYEISLEEALKIAYNSRTDRSIDIGR